MAPKDANNLAPKFLKTEILKVQEVSVSEDSGWRGTDPTRTQEIYHDLKDGNYGCNVMTPPSVLKLKSATDGLIVLDNGKHFCLALRLLADELQNASKTEPPEWACGRLLEALTEGVRFDVVQYVDDSDQDLRLAWNAMKHDLDSNKWLQTGIETKVGIVLSMKGRVPGGDWSLVQKELVKIYGPQKRSTVARWISMAKSPLFGSAPILGWLRRHKDLPHGYVMTNKYFTDENPKVRLSEEMALNALQLLEAKLDAAQSVSVPSFVAEFCTPMAVVSAWRKQMVQRFGVEVTNGPAFQRVFRMLLSDGGRQKVLACRNVPLHGRQGDCGIQECSQLVEELEKLKSTASAAAARSESATGRKDSAVPAMEADEPMMIDKETAELEERDPVEQKASELATAELTQISCFQDFADLKRAVTEIREGEKIIFLVEASTSKATVIKDLIKKCGELVRQMPGEMEKKRFVVSVCVGRRLDIISVVHNELNTVFRENKSYVVQCTAADIQTSKSLPTFRLVSQSRACSGEQLPAHCQLNSVRSKAWEGLRQRCLDPSCKFRTHDVHEGTDSEQEKEEAGDLCQVAEDSDSGPDVADPGAASLSGSGRYVKNLWPFARPIAQGTKLLQQLCHSETASRCVILSRTAHPGQVVACRTVRLRVLAYYEVPTHNYRHGEELLVKMLTRMKHEEAKKCLEASGTRKRTRADDLQFRFVQGPPLSDQLLELRDVALLDSSSWRAGVDRLVDGLHEKVAQLLAEELEKYGLSLVSTEKGKALRAERAFRESDTICVASTLLFSSRSALAYFLNECQAQEFADKLAEVSPVAQNGAASSMFALLVGAAGYAAHYLEHGKKQPNAYLRLDPSKGANDNVLELVVRTSNQQGIAEKAFITLNFGAPYRFGSAEPDGKRMKQQSLSFPVTTKNAVATVIEAPTIAPPLPPNQTKIIEKKDVVTPEKKDVVVTAALPTPPKEPEVKETKAFFSNDNVAGKKIVWSFEDGKMSMRCTEDAERGTKLSPGSFLHTIRYSANGKGQLEAGGIFPFALTEPYVHQVSLLEGKTASPLMTVAEAIQKTGAKKIQSHGGWSSEKPPATLTPPATGQGFQPGDARQCELLKMALNMGQVKAVWLLKFDAESMTLGPYAVSLFTAKQIIVPAKMATLVLQ